MAIFHCATKPIARSSGRSAVAAAAYRSGDCLVDERQGLEHDYTRAAVFSIPSSSCPTAQASGAGPSCGTPRSRREAQGYPHRQGVGSRLDGRDGRSGAAGTGGAIRRRPSLAKLGSTAARWMWRCMPPIGSATTRKVTAGVAGREMRNRAVRCQAPFPRHCASADRSRVRQMWAAEVNRQLKEGRRLERVDHRRSPPSARRQFRRGGSRRPRSSTANPR